MSKDAGGAGREEVMTPQLNSAFSKKMTFVLFLSADLAHAVFAGDMRVRARRGLV